MMDGLRYRPYERYEESNVQWIGKLPSHWKVERSKWLFSDRKERARRGEPQLAATQKYGVIPQSEFMELEGRRVTQVFLDFDILKHVDAGDFVMSMRSFQGGIEYSEHTGCVSSAYVALRPERNVEPAFFRYLLKSKRYIEALQSTSNLVRDGQALRFENFSSVDLFIVPIEEQRAISAFLDDKCTKIDGAVKIKVDQITLLRERRQIIIQDAVTRGLNPAAPMKDSGIDWIGQIPAHWDVKRGKFLFAKVERPVRIQDDIVTCFRDGQVTLRSNRRTEGFTNALQEHGYQGIRKGDLVIHAMDAFAGAIGVSDSDGKATPVYSVCVPRIKNTVDPPFFAQLMRQIALSGLLVSLAKGIRERSTDFRYGDFASLLLVVPPLSEQKEITAYIQAVTEKIENGIAIKERQIAALKEYKTSLINAAVTGKIKVI